MFGFLTFLIMLGVAYAYWREGLLTSCCMFINVFLAGLLTFSVWEPAADQLGPILGGTVLEGYADCLCMVAIFSLVLGLLRLVTNSLSYTTLDFPPLLLHGGAALFGLLTGYLVSGFLICAVWTLPFPASREPIQMRVDPENPRAGLRRIFPPDRLWLALMHRAGVGPFSWGDGKTFDPHGNFPLRYSRFHRKDDNGNLKKDDGTLPAK